MKSLRSRTLRFGACAGLLVLVAAPALAGEFYASGALSISAGIGDPKGHNGDAGGAGTNLPMHGLDTDSSPVFSGAIGFEFPMNQALPRRYRQPSWMPDLDLEDWALRSELEAAGGRNYDFAIGASGLNTHHVKVSSWSLMVNAWLDLPLGHALDAWGMRKLRDVTFNTGVGVGFERTRIVSTNSVAFGAHDANHLLWQVGFELGIPLSDNVTLTGGYRYVPIGELKNNLTDNTSTQNFGRQRLDVSAHELRTGLRVNFYAVRFPRGFFEPERARYEP